MTTGWHILVKLNGVKQPVTIHCPERSPQSWLERIARGGVFDATTQTWYPPSRIVDAKVEPVAERVVR